MKNKIRQKCVKKVRGEAGEKNDAERQRCEPRRKVHLEIFLYVDSFVS